MPYGKSNKSIQDAAFKLRSNNTTPFKQMGSSPVKYKKWLAQKLIKYGAKGAKAIKTAFSKSKVTKYKKPYPKPIPTSQTYVSRKAMTHPQSGKIVLPKSGKLPGHDVNPVTYERAISTGSKQLEKNLKNMLDQMRFLNKK